MSAYTVVLDWAGDNGFLDPLAVHVKAESRDKAWEASWAVAFEMCRGHIYEIPQDAEYDEGLASDLWYSVIIFPGHVKEATA